ncbi:N-acetylneuraminate synthase [Caproiciproducens sp. NJN-50]|uniref:N-acetylneuraminate synthase n=1 Tax=Caproiciproducens sp. NJN-50 TaxID=2507162 RepID=UPI000FFE293A|nr:N-acetylneuraminate synthase [Caproiciproducens sp. NJN-50]QAT48883.1 N-acetylneuraminate synthase [Caproiciproducens sp. NJN-50]
MSPKILIIAEAGVNHNGSLKTAMELVDAAAEAGADAVKFQTYRAERIAVPDAPKAAYQLENSCSGETQYEMIRKLELGESDDLTLQKHAEESGILFLSTAFDPESLDFLLSIGVPLLKIASGEIENAPLLRKAARSGKDVLLSTGMADLGEIEAALGVLAFGYLEYGGEKEVPCLSSFRRAYDSEEGQKALKYHVSLLHCTTEYPAPFPDVNLRALRTLRQCFALPVGYSDHTAGIAVPVAAAALGVSVLEKHLTLDRGLPGPDHKASLEPQEFARMVQGIRQVEQSLGTSVKRPSPSELRNQAVARKSIVAACRIEQGELFTDRNLTVKRPAGGRSPMEYFDLLGKKAGRSYLENEAIR